MSFERSSPFNIDRVFLNRWSPRSFTPQAMSDQEVLGVIEAARWAPSAYNIQPWRFIYSLRTDDQWADFVDLLDDFNRSWAKNAAALIFLVSEQWSETEADKEAKPSSYNSFDAGAAWAQLALQATHDGYSAHAMAGIHKDRVHQVLNVPERFKVEIAIALGYRGNPEDLPQNLQEREMPSPRMPLEQIAFKGGFENEPAS